MSETRAATISIAAGAAERRTVRLLMRLITVPLTVISVVAGVWITGGVITNDFAVAMWLAAGWMALAGLVAVGIAVRSRTFGVPVLGAYLLTALVLGAYLGASVF